jgi:hypothetical protein
VANQPARVWIGVDSRGAPPVPSATASLRVEPAPATDQGVFETMLGALIGFFFG